MAEEKFDATKYKNDFQKEKYDRIIVNVPKGQKEIIDSYAKTHTLSHTWKPMVRRENR